MEEVVQRAKGAVRIICGWLEANGLQLEDHKTETVLVTSRKTRKVIILRVGKLEILLQPSLRYRGIQSDARFRFDKHL